MINPEKLDQPIDASATKGIVARDISKISDNDSLDRRVGAPDTSVRPEVANAYRQLQEGTITRKEYDTVVLGTISEYDFVPDPATYDAMYGALDSQKKEIKNKYPN